MPLAPVMAQSCCPVWLVASLLLLVTLALFWPVTGCEFVNFDDPAFITENPHVQGGWNWEGVKWAFCNTEQGAYWAPLMWLSHILAWQLFGLNPWGHHLINVLLHAANTALVFLVFRRLTQATWRSLMVAALFGWHPLRVEAVAWVTHRTDDLSMLFGMLTLWAYAKYVEAAPARSPRFNHWYGVTVGVFVLGLMSKPVQVVTLPCVLLLLDYWPLGRRQKAEGGMWNAEAAGTSALRSATEDGQPATPVLRSPSSVALRRVDITAEGGRNPDHVSRFTFHVSLLLEKLPFLFLAAVASVVTFLAQKQGGNLGMNESLPLRARVGNALISYSRYLGKLFWPTDLAVYYPHPGHWPLGQVVLAGGVIVGLSVLVWWRRRRHPYLLMGWLWFVGTLVPMIGLVQAGGQAIADRWTYLPSLGVLIPTVWGTYELTRRCRHELLAWSVAGGAAIMLCLALTRQQIGYWKDSETLFRHALKVTENNALAHNSLGLALDEKGQIDEAIRQYEEAVRLAPDFPDAHNNLGIALLKKGQPDEAIHEFQDVLRLKPDRASGRYNLGLALLKNGQVDEAISRLQEFLHLKPDDADAHSHLGEALAMKGQVDAAISQLRESLRLKPDNADTHINLGTAFGQSGRTSEAIREFQEALRLNPAQADAHNYLGIILFKEGQVDEAIRHYQEALRQSPDHAHAHDNLGAALIKKGQIDEAISQFREASRLTPRDADMHNNLGAALEKKGQIDEAIREYLHAIRLKADYLDAHNNLGHALLKKGQIDAVIGEFQEAVRLKPDNADAHYNLGIALFRKNQIDEAIHQFQEAVRLEPDYASAHNNLGAAFMRKGQIDAAISEFQQSLRLKPDQANAHNNLGIALGQSGRPSEAIREFREALRVNPDFASARTNLEAALAAQAGSARLPGTSTNR